MQLGTRAHGLGLFLCPLRPGGSAGQWHWPRRWPRTRSESGTDRQAGGGFFFFLFFFFFHFKNISLLATCAHYLASQGAERLTCPWEQSQSRDPAFKARGHPWPPRRQISACPERRSQPFHSEMPPRPPGAGLRLPTWGSQYRLPDESTNLGQAARRETGRLLRHRPRRCGSQGEEAGGGCQRKQSGRWPAPSRDFRTGEREAPRTTGWARCPGASARLRSTLSLHSQKSGFYAAVNRAEQWSALGRGKQARPGPPSRD